MRGKPCVAGFQAACGGSIPAYAGETHLYSQPRQADPVDPRVCGGNDPTKSAVYAAKGRSPRMRGKRRFTKSEVAEHRSIPAYAGETHA